MKRILVLCGMLAYAAIAVAQIKLSEVRKQYVECASSEDKAKELWKNLDDLSDPAPAMLAYKGAVKSVLAKYQWLVNKKYSYAVEGMRSMNDAVSRDPENIEIRYLRFTIQYHLPGFLGLSKDLKSDKDKFISSMKKRSSYGIDDAYFKEMVNFIISTDQCTADEITTLKKEAGIK